MLIHVRAPLGLGLAGGGSYLLPYCDEFGGVVLNLTIDRCAHAFINARDYKRILRSWYYESCGIGPKAISAGPAHEPGAAGRTQADAAEKTVTEIATRYGFGGSGVK